MSTEYRFLRTSALGRCALLFALLASSCVQKPAEAVDWGAAFERTDGFGWSGGDAADSVPLPGNRILWIFGDSYVGGVAKGTRQSTEFRFGNTIAIQQNVSGSTAPAPEDMFFDWGPRGSNGWLPIPRELLSDPAAPASAKLALEQNLPLFSWPLHGIVVGDDLVLFNMPVTSNGCEVCGLFPFKVHGTVATVIRSVNLPYDQWGVRPGAGWDAAHQPQPKFVPHARAAEALDDTTGLLWGSFVMRDPSDPTGVYVYGHREANKLGSLVVARVPGVQTADDIMDFPRWTFWDGGTWISDPDAAAAIAGDSGVEASVVPIPEGEGGGFALVQSGNLFTGEIRVAVASEPWGPFVDRYRLSLMDCPVSGFDPKTEQITYAAKAHPELSDDEALLVSLITVPHDSANSKVVANAVQYTPRFMSIPWVEISEQSHSSPDRCGSDVAIR
jgi:hypothetical protein